MMNHNPHGGPPIYQGRRHHEVSYTTQHHYPPNMYHYHPQHVPQPFHHGPPQQWAYYNMQVPMGRPYQQPYPPMMPPYAMAQPPSMSPRPTPPQQVPSSSSVRSHQSMPSSSPGPDRPSQPTQLPASLSHPSLSPIPPTTAIARVPFQPPLPWHSVPEEEFPKQIVGRRRVIPIQRPNVRVELPTRDGETDFARSMRRTETTSELSSEHFDQPTRAVSTAETNVETPGTSLAPSQDNLTSSTAPASQHPAILMNNPLQPRKVVPVVPVIPNLPSKTRDKKAIDGAPDPTKLPDQVEHTDISVYMNSTEAPHTATGSLGQTMKDETMKDETLNLSVEKPHPRSWADLVRSQVSQGLTVTQANGQNLSTHNGPVPTPNEAKATFLSSFSVRRCDSGNKLSFLKPRGLINTGNMCYMNSVLQILLFCVPFYDFLEQARKQAAYSFKSETLMIDAMIEFIREFSIIDSATSPEQLNLRLKDQELEEYGEAFTPEFVYDVIRRLPRFSSMRRGHQQDAEEFLGFLLEEMHEECVRVMKGTHSEIDEIRSSTESSTISDDSGWHEVGPKQRAAITRSAGIIEADSPITKIFGGKLRSELRVPGAKPSVTLEPYQPLQLDIGSPQITNITEALKGLTRPETLHGDFNSPRGPGVNATKQVFVESLPPVLILHLKRFQYDNAGGTQKIWKKVGYPLELEIPKEVFPQHKRGGIIAHGGLPKYRLIGVVYHHGKNASGGHYTVDVRRQNDKEWIRLDDTVIRRVKSEDVAEGGAEEDPKLLAVALEQHKRDESSGSNIFDLVRDDSEQGLQAEKGWNQVNGGSTQTTKKWSGVVNGTTTPTSSSGRRTPMGRYSVKDNKVAYILFYQKMGY